MTNAIRSFGSPSHVRSRLVGVDAWRADISGGRATPLYSVAGGGTRRVDVNLVGRAVCGIFSSTTG